MKYLASPMHFIGQLFALVMISACFLGGCAELDQLTKPRVEGLQQDPGFDGATLAAGGIGATSVSSDVTGKKVNVDSLQVMLDVAIRNKRPDLAVSHDGRYSVKADVIANDVSKRTEDIGSTVYRWTKRRVMVNYQVRDITTGNRVWSGLIETYEESLSSYEKMKKEKSRDKVLDAIAAAISKEKSQPYPEPPLFSDVAKLNFEGFALNLPVNK